MYKALQAIGWRTLLGDNIRQLNEDNVAFLCDELKVHGHKKRDVTEISWQYALQCAIEYERGMSPLFSDQPSPEGWQEGWQITRSQAEREAAAYVASLAETSVQTRGDRPCRSCKHLNDIGLRPRLIRSMSAPPHATADRAREAGLLDFHLDLDPWVPYQEPRSYNSWGSPINETADEADSTNEDATRHTQAPAYSFLTELASPPPSYCEKTPDPRDQTMPFIPLDAHAPIAEPEQLGARAVRKRKRGTREVDLDTQQEEERPSSRPRLLRATKARKIGT